MNGEQNIKQLPKGWKWVKLGEVCLDKEGLRRGPFGSAIKKDFFVPNGYKVYEQSNAIYDDAFRGKYFLDEKKYQELINFNVQPGDLIVSCSGTLGRIAEIPKNAMPGVINQALLRVRLKKDIIEKKYFLYNFRSSQFQRKIFDQSQGTAMSNLVGIKDFKLIEIFLPPLPTQLAIVSKIEELFSELDKGIENLRLAQQQLKTYRQSVLKVAFEGRLTRGLNHDSFDLHDEHDLNIAAEPTIKYKTKKNQGNQDNPINHGSDKGDLPEGWKIIPLKDLAELITDGDHQAPPKSNEGVPFITISNINKESNKIDFSDTFSVLKEYYLNLKESRKPLKGDILYTVTGSFGIPVLIDYEKEFCFQRHIGLIRPLKTINQKWLYYLMLSPTVYFQARDTATGTAQKTVALNSLRNFQVPICTIAEQTQIVQAIESRLSVADKLEESITQSLQQAEILRQSILKKAFEGRLVVEKQVQPHKPKNEYFYQVQVLGLIAKASKKNNIAHGEMTIAKYAYLLDKIYNIPTYYNFQRWHLGPYPPEIKKAVNNKQFFTMAGGSIQLANETELFKYNIPNKENIEKAVNELSFAFSKFTDKERAYKTELLATVCKVVEDIQTTALAEVRASMKDWIINLKNASFKNKAEKFTEKETKRCLAFIAERKWDKKLLNIV
jgi:type I restriction enzyme, S subunit